MDGLVPPLHATVTLHIENHYELYDMVETTRTVTIPLPPADESSDAYDDWRENYIQPETGTGRPDGDSWYFVRITASTVPALLDREFEFGI